MKDFRLVLELLNVTEYGIEECRVIEYPDRIQAFQELVDGDWITIEKGYLLNDEIKEDK